MKAAPQEFSKAKKVAGDHEQKFVAKKLLAESNEMIAGMEATGACSPLLEDGGEEFLVAARTYTLAAVLRDHLPT